MDGQKNTTWDIWKVLILVRAMKHGLDYYICTLKLSHLK